jgi:predicted dehydrogenase
MVAAKKKILVVGTGTIGERHTRCILATNRAEVSICETNDHVRKKIADKYNIKNTYADFALALEAGHDAIVIATPAHLHIPMAQQAAESGLHLLIEKPLSTSLDGIDHLDRTIRERKLIAGVAYVLRHIPELTAMKKALDSGRFGRPLHITVTRGQHFPTSRPNYRDIYYASHAMGGGAVQDGLTHLINAVSWLAGPVERLVADCAHQVLEGVEVEDTVNVLTRHGDALACFSMNQYQAPDEGVITVVCERGTLRSELHCNRMRWMMEPETEWQQESWPDFEREHAFIAQANTFFDAIDGQREMPCTLSEARHTLECNLAIMEASRNPANWKIL